MLQTINLPQQKCEWRQSVEVLCATWHEQDDVNYIQACCPQFPAISDGLFCLCKYSLNNYMIV